MARADATADELRAEIAERRQVRQRVAAEKEQLNLEIEEAKARQVLRRELEKEEDLLETEMSGKRDLRNFLTNINHDWAGPSLPDTLAVNRSSFDWGSPESLVACTDCGESVRNSEIQWSIKNMSWLQNTLKQMVERTVVSPSVCNHGHQFYLEYHPDGGIIYPIGLRGTLVLYHELENCQRGRNSLNFRYTMWIQSKDRGFVQWGDSPEICIVGEDTCDKIFGPDVCAKDGIPAGIFGLTHGQLLKSEWVIDDALTIKVKIEIRGYDAIDSKMDECEIVVQASQLGQELLFLLENGTNADVTFVLQGEEVRAHSAIIAARSEVFQRQLSCGLKESTSKRIDIEDCDQSVFKAVLRYLYSDSFDCVEKFIAEKVAESSTSSSANAHASSSSKVSVFGIRARMMQELLAVSHKYQLTRLQLWCERELWGCVSIEDVCAILCQAHLYEARQLEQKCLGFIKNNMHQVCKSDSFGALLQAWPEVSLKIAMRAGDIPEDTTAKVLESHENARKRKREDQECSLPRVSLAVALG